MLHMLLEKDKYAEKEGGWGVPTEHEEASDVSSGGDDVWWGQYLKLTMAWR